MDLADVPHAVVLERYARKYRPHSIRLWARGGGFSGARLWSIEAPAGRFALRAWPPGHPSPERLSFIHAVLRHAAGRGFHRLPLPVPTEAGASYLEQRGRLWQLEPWMPGAADYHAAPSPARLTAALTALAEFHLAVADFREGNATLPPALLADVRPSRGLAERVAFAEALLTGELEAIARAIRPRVASAVAALAPLILRQVEQVLPAVYPRLKAATEIAVVHQPCIRDLWHDHVFFTQDEVTAFIDFGSMRMETVAADLARLLASLAPDDPRSWSIGLAAYTARRPLSDAERQLLVAYDQSAAALTAVQWLAWIYRDGRTFDDDQAVLARVKLGLARLETLARTISAGDLD